MKRKSLTIVILVILGVILTVIVVDFLNNRPDRRGENPFALEVDQYKEVDPGLVSHKEVRNFSLGSFDASAMVYFNDTLFITGDSTLALVLPDGSPVARYDIMPEPTSIAIDAQNIFIGYMNYVARYDHSGNLVQQWDTLGERAVVTNLAIGGNKVYAADAGNRRVVIYSIDGARLGSFEGKAQTEAGHGFIVPSPNFDLVVNGYGELWVVNPGKHALENYSDDGRMRGFWENSSIEVEGFLGCCNPARIAVLDEGAFITSEKGLVRIKIYGQSGALKSVVATPDLFKEEGEAPDVCAGQPGIIYALDFDRNVIRVFEEMEEG